MALPVHMVLLGNVWHDNLFCDVVYESAMLNENRTRRTANVGWPRPRPEVTGFRNYSRADRASLYTSYRLKRIRVVQTVLPISSRCNPGKHIHVVGCEEPSVSVVDIFRDRDVVDLVI